MADKKAFLLRLDPAVWAVVERLAQRELRSVNAQIEYLLREALAKRRNRRRSSPPAGRSQPGGAISRARARRTR